MKMEFECTQILNIEKKVNILISNFVEINFMIKTNDKKFTTFRPSGGHFQGGVKNVQVISINMFATVKNRLKNTMITKKQ